MQLQRLPSSITHRTTTPTPAAYFCVCKRVCLDFVQKLCDPLTDLRHLCDKIIVCGDLNADIRQKSGKGDMLRKIFGLYELHDDFKKSTGIALDLIGKKSESMIDCMVTKILEGCYDCTLCNLNVAGHRA